MDPEARYVPKYDANLYDLSTGKAFILDGW